MISRRTAKGGTTIAASQRALIEQVSLEIRRMGAQSVLTSQTIADRFGLHPTDLECLDLIYLRGQATPGDLAKATGLTSGAMTAVIDRLERAGYVVRDPDPNDRRRHLIRNQAEAIEPIKATYAPMQAAMFKLWSGFSARDLRVIAKFLLHSTDLAVACTQDIRDATPSSSGKRRLPRMSQRVQGQAKSRPQTFPEAQTRKAK
jgi:DNA-binding MarR family transcriptional regulator